PFPKSCSFAYFFLVAELPPADASFVAVLIGLASLVPAPLSAAGLSSPDDFFSSAAESLPVPAGDVFHSATFQYCCVVATRLARSVRHSLNMALVMSSLAMKHSSTIFL